MGLGGVEIVVLLDELLEEGMFWACGVDYTDGIGL